MKKLIALVLVITFIGMNCATYEKGEGINLEPGQKPGAKLVIQKKDGEQIRGELIAVKKDSLLLKDSQTGADVAVDITETETIKIVRKSKAGKGALYGGLITFFIGYGIGVFMDEEGGDDDIPAPLTAIIFGAIVAPIGILLGAFIGIYAGTDKTIQIKGKSEAEIKSILDDLRKKAKVPDFQ